MKKWAQKQTGFTIVELLIVVVVIAILAAITIVSYNGIKNRAIESQVKTGLEQATKKVLTYATLNNEMYPDTLADAGITDTASISYQYSSNNATNPKTYAITASNGPVGSVVYYLSSTQTVASAGIAPGHNLIVWDKTDNSTVPIVMSSGMLIDTSVFKDSTASVRLAPSTTGKMLRNSPVSGNPGQVLTVKFWILTDASWNGTSSNSKVRFGTSPGGTLIGAFEYSGVKLAWTQFSCSYTFTVTNPIVTISVGNDGTVGNIWLDNVSVSVQ